MSLYPFAKFVTGLILKLGGMRIIGQENIPKDKTLIIIANHISFGDPPVLSQAFSFPLTYIAKEDFAKNMLTHLVFGACGAVFLKSGESDLTALRYAIKTLKEGRAIAIFPEGHRNYNQVMSEFKPGAAYIAQRTGSPVLPVSLINTGDFWHFWRRNIVVNIGQPITVEKKENSGKEYLDHYNALFFQKVGELLQESKILLEKEGKKMRKFNENCR